jgi:hypothetical protein
MPLLSIEEPRLLTDEAIEAAVQALLDGRRMVRRAGLVGWRAQDFDTAAALLR